MEYECGFCDKRGSMDIFAHLSSGSMEENSETFIACPDCGSETINPVVIIKIDSKKILGLVPPPLRLSRFKMEYLSVSMLTGVFIFLLE